MERIEFPSLVTFNRICIGGITQSSNGWWVPKVKVHCSYMGIKDGCGQLRAEQAKELVIQAYVQYLVKKRGWTDAERDKRLSHAHELDKEFHREKLAHSLQDSAKRMRDREQSQSVQSELVWHNEWFKVVKIIREQSTIFLVKLNKRRGWRNIVSQVIEVGKSQPGQIRWRFTCLDEALSFIDSVEV